MSFWQSTKSLTAFIRQFFKPIEGLDPQGHQWYRRKEDTTDSSAIKRDQPWIHQEPWAEGLTNELRPHLGATEKIPKSLMWHIGWHCQQLCLSARRGQYSPISYLQIWCSNNHLKFWNQHRTLKLLSCLSLTGCIRWGQFSSNWTWTEIHWN